MKTTILFVITLFTTAAIAQVNPIDFETGGNGADWTWTVFENDTNPDLEFIANPDPSGINTSATVAKFTALQTGQPFAGCESMHGSDIGTFTLDANNAFVAIMVWKDVISDVGIKLVTPPGGSTGEIKVPNTLVNQWERLIFDFTGVIGSPETTGVDQIVVFPDFNARTSDNVIYFDNIEFGDATLAVDTPEDVRLSVFPNPTTDLVNVSSAQIIEEALLYNALGQQLRLLQPMQKDFALTTAGLPSGIYFLRLSGGASKEIVKLVIE